jgi:hypothetical protein
MPATDMAGGKRVQKALVRCRVPGTVVVLVAHLAQQSEKTALVAALGAHNVFDEDPSWPARTSVYSAFRGIKFRP